MSWPRLDESNRGLSKTIVASEDGYIHVSGSGNWSSITGASSGTEVNSNPLLIQSVVTAAGVKNNSRAFWKFGVQPLSSFKRLYNARLYFYVVNINDDLRFYLSTQGSTLTGADYDAITTTEIGTITQAGGTGWRYIELPREIIRHIEIKARDGSDAFFTIVARTSNLDVRGLTPSDHQYVNSISSSDVSTVAKLIVGVYKSRASETNSEVNQDFSMQHFTENAMSDQFPRSVDQVPFSYGVKTPFILNQRNNATYKNSSRSNTYKVTKTTN